MFGSVLVLATWFYLASLVVLVGASVDVVRRRIGRADGGDQEASS